jgi:hypothetical protein
MERARAKKARGGKRQATSQESEEEADGSEE